MTTMRVLAKFGGWEVVQDANSVVSIHFGNGMWICGHIGAYDAVKAEVKDPAIRKELLKQVFAGMNGGNRHD